LKTLAEKPESSWHELSDLETSIRSPETSDDIAAIAERKSGDLNGDRILNAIELGDASSRKRLSAGESTGYQMLVVQRSAGDATPRLKLERMDAGERAWEAVDGLTWPEDESVVVGRRGCCDPRRSMDLS
jgi:hypothetical protein